MYHEKATMEMNKKLRLSYPTYAVIITQNWSSQISLSKNCLFSLMFCFYIIVFYNVLLYFYKISVCLVSSVKEI